MDQPQFFRQLSEAISDAAMDPAAWPIFLERFAATIGSNSVSLHWETVDSSRRSRFAFKHGLAATVSDEYERYYGPRNPVVANAGALISPGRGVLRQEACSESTFRSSEFYNDFLKPNDFLHVLGGTIAASGRDLCLISILGSHRRDPFTTDDKRLLEALIPHMRTALILQDRLSAAQERLRRFETAFDAVPDAAVLVDHRSVVLAANDAARAVLRNREGIRMEQDRLRLRSRTLDARLSQALRGLGLAKRFNLPTPSGSALRVPHPSGDFDWLLQIFPVEKQMPGTAVVFIVPSRGGAAPSESDLRGLFGLSPMQGQIALRLFEGLEPNDIGDRLNITRNTLRTHLRRLFVKLGVSRQTELIRLVARVKPRR